MPITITMPALSPTMEEGNLAKWLVKEGDKVSAGDVIAEIETDKATMEVEAVDEGIVARIVVAEGTEAVKVNAAIAILAEEGEDVSDAASAVPQSDPAAMATEPPESPDSEEQPEAAPPASTGSTSIVSQTVRSEGSASDRIFASPLARRIAEKKGLDLSSVKGSGPRGRIVKADVENASATSVTTAGVPSGQRGVAASGMSDDMTRALFSDGSFEAKPHDGMRKVIASRLTESSQTIPAYFITMECELDALLSLRSQINAAAPQNEDGKPEYKISVNDFIVKAMAAALQDVPLANVSWTSTDRLYHKHSDVGVAVAVDDGLFTPIVRIAETKTLSTISAEIKDLAGRARTRKLLPEEYQGGCTAVSNLGMFGVREFTSIINPPHASIVSIGAGEKRPVVRNDDLTIATIMSATFAFDHRAIDGALGAELAAAFKRRIENPTGMLV